MTQQLYLEDVSVGDALPPLPVTVDETQMFFFSAATYNGHRIHYDRATYDDLVARGLVTDHQIA